MNIEAPYKEEMGKGGWPLYCDICGQIASVNFWDMKETASNSRWCTWEHDGPIRSRCEKHRRAPKTTYPNGIIMGGHAM